MTLDNFPLKKNHYEVLGVSKDVDAVKLHKAFRLLSKSLHPDTTTLPHDEAKFRFYEVKEAYELLADPNLRKIYDSQLELESKARRPLIKENLSFNKGYDHVNTETEVRRPLSGGELFTLMLLVGSILLSLFLALVFASAQGGEMQVVPSWLLAEDSTSNVLFQDLSDVKSSTS